METTEKKSFLNRIRPNFIWIIFVVVAWYVFIGGFAALLLGYLFDAIGSNFSPGVTFTLQLYGTTLSNIIVLFILCAIFKKNRFIFRSFLLPGRKSEDEDVQLLTDDDVKAEFYGRGNNSLGMLGKGLILGFITNFACIVVALAHGDIKLYLDSSISQIPLLLFALFCVCIQSSSEELWCRGFMYERLHERYPLWFVMLINGLFFGILHVWNPGATVLSIVSIVVCGVSYSLLRWYSGNIWIAMGIHTGWNFTQNYLFGLPNSGLVSEVSVFHLDAAKAASSLVYDYGFGVEGGLTAVITDALLGIICLLLARKAGRLGELKMNYRQTQESRGISVPEGN